MFLWPEVVSYQSAAGINVSMSIYMDKRYDVFISYSRKDAAEAEVICAALSEVGLTYFIDKEGISGGANFPEVLSNMIDASGVFLLIAGKNAYNSKFTRAEILYAFNHKPSGCIIPWLLDSSTMPADLEFLLGNVNWLFRNTHSTEDFIHAVRNALDNPSASSPRSRAVKKGLRWGFVWALVLVFATGIWFSLKKIQAKDGVSADYIAYEQHRMRADSLLKQATMWKNSSNAAETTSDQIKAIQEAGVALVYADSLRKRYVGTSEQYRFGQGVLQEMKLVSERLDSMHLSLIRLAQDSYDMYLLTDSPFEAEYTVCCIDQALSIRDNMDLRNMKEKILGK